MAFFPIEFINNHLVDNLNLTLPQTLQKSFEDLFCAFGENVHFVYLSSFRRVRIGYETPEQVVRARIGMHKKEIYGTTLSLYFLQVREQRRLIGDGGGGFHGSFRLDSSWSLQRQ